MSTTIRPYGDLNYEVAAREQRKLEEVRKLEQKALAKGRLRAGNILDKAHAAREKKLAGAEAQRQAAAQQREEAARKSDEALKAKLRRRFFEQNKNATEADFLRLFPQLRDRAMLESTEAANKIAAREYLHL